MSGLIISSNGRGRRKRPKPSLLSVGDASNPAIGGARGAARGVISGRSSAGSTATSIMMPDKANCLRSSPKSSLKSLKSLEGRGERGGGLSSAAATATVSTATSLLIENQREFFMVGKNKKNGMTSKAKASMSSVKKGILRDRSHRTTEIFRASGFSYAVTIRGLVGEEELADIREDQEEMDEVVDNVLELCKGAASPNRASEAPSAESVSVTGCGDVVVELSSRDLCKEIARGLNGRVVQGNKIVAEGDFSPDHVLCYKVGEEGSRDAESPAVAETSKAAELERLASREGSSFRRNGGLCFIDCGSPRGAEAFVAIVDSELAERRIGRPEYLTSHRPCILKVTEMVSEEDCVDEEELQEIYNDLMGMFGEHGHCDVCICASSRDAGGCKKWCPGRAGGKPKAAKPDVAAQPSLSVFDGQGGGDDEGKDCVHVMYYNFDDGILAESLMRGKIVQGSEVNACLAETSADPKVPKAYRQMLGSNMLPKHNYAAAAAGCDVEGSNGDPRIALASTALTCTEEVKEMCAGVSESPRRESCAFHFCFYIFCFFFFSPAHDHHHQHHVRPSPHR